MKLLMPYTSFSICISSALLRNGVILCSTLQKKFTLKVNCTEPRAHSLSLYNIFYKKLIK